MNMMRVLVGLVMGAAAGAVLTEVVLGNEAVRVWLVNPTSLLVWGGAILVGAVVAAVSPRRFELPVAAFSVLFGSLAGLLWFGSSQNFSLADPANALSFGGAFLKSGFCLLVFAAIGGWIVAGIRSRMEENRDEDALRGQYRARSHR